MTCHELELVQRQSGESVASRFRHSSASSSAFVVYNLVEDCHFYVLI